MKKFFKKPVSIILAILMVMSVFIAVPMTASALTRDDVESLMSSMEAMIDGYMAHNDMEHAESLIGYYNKLSEALYQANGQVTPVVESRYNEAYTYFTENGGTVSGGQGGSGSGGSYPDVNNVYRATDGPVEVTVSDLQPGDVLVTSSDPLEVRKGDCNIVLVGGTYGEGDALEGTLFATYPSNVTLGNEIRFEFSDNYARITDMDNHGRYDPVYNNALGNAYMVLGNDNGTVYLAGYNFTTYTITWKDYNGSDLYDGQSTVAPGTVPYYRWSVSRSSTAQYSYTFTGWTDSSNTFYSKDSDLPAATQDETYTATYSQTLRSYTITWKDGDNKTLKSESVAYGTTPSYTGATPTKTEDDDYTYEFNNTWSPSVASVTGNATYTAQFTAVPKPAPTTYTVTWKNDDTTLKTDTVEEGNAPAYTGTVPEKAEDEQYTYTFSGWTDGTTTYGATDTLPAVTGDITYTATFDSTKRSYTITWKNDDGFVIDTTTVEYGETPTHADATKEATAQYTYTFAGWTPEIAAVTGDAEYTATYTATDNHLNGPQDDGCFYLNDVKQIRYQLIQWHGDYYFINDGDKYVKNSKLYLSNTYVAGSGLAAGLYEFGADGKMLLTNGPQDDGYFYENGVRSNKLYRLVEFEGDWYFINDGYKYAKNAHLYLSGSFLSGTDFEAGYYDFDADGKLNIPEELPDGANEDGYIYINGVKQTRYQLIKYGNDYYFINDGDQYAKNTKLYLNSSFVSGTDLPAGLYEFGADGKMLLKNGPLDDGYFYENGVRSNKLYRLVEFEGDWYFINDGYKYAKNARLYLSGSFLSGTDFEAGYFNFGADGKMVTD